MPADDLRRRLHNPDYWLGPPPSLLDRMLWGIGYGLVAVLLVLMSAVGLAFIIYLLASIALRLGL